MVIEISLVSGEAALAVAPEIAKLRADAWGEVLEDRAVLSRFAFDDIDRAGWHRLVRNPAGELIAASRFCLIHKGDSIPDAVGFAPVIDKIEYPAIFFNRSVVRADSRGKGLWQKQIRANLESGLKMNPQEVWSESSGSRINFLHHLGFKTICSSADKEVPGEFYLLRYRKRSTNTV